MMRSGIVGVECDIGIVPRRGAAPRVPRHDFSTISAMRRRTKVPPPAPTGPLKSIERRRSKISGWGVYALEPITKNSRIVHYAGEKITHRESWPREETHLANGHIWCFKVNNRWVR